MLLVLPSTSVNNVASYAATLDGLERIKVLRIDLLCSRDGLVVPTAVAGLVAPQQEEANTSRIENVKHPVRETTDLRTSCSALLEKKHQSFSAAS